MLLVEKIPWKKYATVLAKLGEANCFSIPGFLA